MNSKTINYSQPSAASGDIFRTFEDMEVHKVSREFRKAMYAVARRLPDFEKFGLTSQMRRAAMSLTNNLAEGHGRFHFLDQIKFALIARGSLEELMDDLNVCLDEGYLPSQELAGLKSSGWHVLKLINGWLRYLRDRKMGSSVALHDAPSSTGSDDSEESMEWLAELLEAHPELLPSRDEPHSPI
jgi:four helix bundle protein